MISGHVTLYSRHLDKDNDVDAVDWNDYLKGSTLFNKFIFCDTL